MQQTCFDNGLYHYVDIRVTRSNTIDVKQWKAVHRKCRHIYSLVPPVGGLHTLCVECRILNIGILSTNPRECSTFSDKHRILGSAQHTCTTYMYMWYVHVIKNNNMQDTDRDWQSVTFSTIPAPRRRIALFFLSLRGGENTILSVFNSARGIVTMTYDNVWWETRILTYTHTHHTYPHTPCQQSTPCNPHTLLSSSQSPSSQSSEH